MPKRCKISKCFMQVNCPLKQSIYEFKVRTLNHTFNPVAFLCKLRAAVYSYSGILRSQHEADV